MLHKAKVGDMVHSQFFFKDGTPFDGKRRPLVLIELRGDTHLVLPFSAHTQILPFSTSDI
jgi:hypothetical protein